MKDTSFPQAVVTGLNHITALNTVWSLSEMGVPVIGIHSRENSPLAHTRKCKTIYCPGDHDEDLIKCLNQLAKDFRQPAVLIPCTDIHVLQISERREELQASYRFGLPSKQVVNDLMEKTSFSELAMKKKLPIPKTFLVNSLADLQKIEEEITFPCILKPVYRTKTWDEQFVRNKVFKIETREKLFQYVKASLKLINSLILQEWISGGDEDVYFCLTYFNKEACPLASFTGKKIRQWPVEIGSTASAEPVIEDDVRDSTLDFFRKIGYQGLGSIEFKRDHKDNIFKITEPTVGRPNLQSYISTINGINLAYIAYCDLIGRPIQKKWQALSSKPVKWVNEWAEYERYRFQRETGKANIIKILSSLKGQRRYGLFSLTDPLPFIYKIWERFSKKFKKYFH